MAPDVQFELTPGDIEDGCVTPADGCGRWNRPVVFAYRAGIATGGASAFDHFEPTQGQVVDLAVSPDGHRVSAELRPHRKGGEHTLVAMFSSRTGWVKRSARFTTPNPETLRCEPASCSTPGRLRPQKNPPRLPLRRLPSEGEVVFALTGAGPLVPRPDLFPPTVAFAVGFPLEAKPPDVTCSTGRVSVSKAADEPPGYLSWYEVALVPVPADGRMRSGVLRCEARFTALVPGGTPSEHSGSLSLTVAPDGSVSVRD